MNIRSIRLHGGYLSERSAVVKASDLRKPLSRHRFKNLATMDFIDLADELLELEV